MTQWDLTFNWDKALEKNRAALLALVALLFRFVAKATDGKGLPRAGHNEIRRLLRVIESATRRLIVIKAAQLPAAKLRDTKAWTINFADFDKAPQKEACPSFKLFDPRKRFAERAARKPVPRIRTFAAHETVVAPPKRDTTPDLKKLEARLGAVRGALNAIPEQAKRLNRAMARRATKPAGPGCVGPMRPGLPPGYRRKVRDGADALLHECHVLALDAENVEPQNTGPPSHF